MSARPAKLGLPVVNVAKASPTEEGLIVYDRATKSLHVSDGNAWVSLSGSKDEDRAVSGFSVKKDLTINRLQATTVMATSQLAAPPKPRALDLTPGSLYFDAASNNLIMTGSNGLPTTSVLLAATNNTIAIGGTPTAPTIGGNYVAGAGVSIAGNVIGGNYVAGAGISVIGNVIASTLKPTIFSTSFTSASADSYTLTGAFVDQVITRIPYAGSSVSPITAFTLVLGFSAGTPTGSFTLVDQATSNVIATLTYNGIVAGSAIYSTTSIANVPSSASILNIVLNAGGVAPAILLFSALIN